LREGKAPREKERSALGFYDRVILPRLTDLSCGTKPVRYQRRKVVPLAEGRVLEIGVGSGLNLPHYDPAKVERVFALEPSAAMLARAKERIEAAPFPVEPLGLEGEAIPLDDKSVDTVLITYTLCTIPGVIAALEGMRRVLRPAGRLIFCEHGLAPDPGVARWQHRLNPLWKRFAGGCNLDRDIPALIKQGGFAIEQIDTMYLPGPKMLRFGAFNYWGTAKPG
jgi:ubiquinone/menaquinone biosynthesis C-methylase UbiE